MGPIGESSPLAGHPGGFPERGYAKMAGWLVGFCERENPKSIMEDWGYAHDSGKNTLIIFRSLVTFVHVLNGK